MLAVIMILLLLIIIVLETMCNSKIMNIITLNVFLSVFKEVAHPGEGSRGSEVGHQAVLPAQRHQQRRVQGHPEESRAQGKHAFSP